MFKYDYVHEKFYHAVHGMAVNPGRLQDRIADAYTFHLLMFEANELPDDLRLDFKKLQEQLTRFEAEASEGKIQASVNRLTDDEAYKIAKSICDMHDRIQSEYYEDVYRKEFQR